MVPIYPGGEELDPMIKKTVPDRKKGARKLRKGERAVAGRNTSSATGNPRSRQKKTEGGERGQRK